MSAASPGPVDWDDFRRLMPIAERWAYFDHAAVAPLPAPTRDALTQWAVEAAADGNTAWPRWARRLEEARGLFARMISARPEEIALLRNTTEGINLVAEGFPWQAGDNLVTFDNEFPSNLYPWMNLASRGVETRRVATSDGRAESSNLFPACDGRTRVISVSWVGYASGWRCDLDALVDFAKRRDIFLFVDAIQGLGVLPLDVQRTPIDCLAADGHKWLLGPEGAGVFYLRADRLDLLSPRGVGWNSVQRSYDFGQIDLTLKHAAARYEGGSANMAGFHGLAASLELLARFGQPALERRILDIAEMACQRLESRGARIVSPRDAAHRSGIVQFELPGQNHAEVRQRLLDRGVVLSARGSGLRISPHAYNNENDVERLIDGL